MRTTRLGRQGAGQTSPEAEAAVICDPPQDTSDPQAMAQLMGSLDEDHDGEMTFPEFWQLLGTLASKQGGFS